LSAYEFEVERISNWPALFRDNPTTLLKDYNIGKRITLLCRSTA
jgi:hypothetical protein